MGAITMPTHSVKSHRALQVTGPSEADDTPPPKLLPADPASEGSIETIIPTTSGFAESGIYRGVQTAARRKATIAPGRDREGCLAKRHLSR